MQKVVVNTETPYEVLIGAGLLARSGEIIADAISSEKIALFGDDTVYGLYGERVAASLRGAGKKVYPFVFPHGESSKRAEYYLKGLDVLAERGFDRTDAVAALGGGVTGDLAGFVASTYLRGIAYAQIPTTLLAQVDSSVGGKTGIDLGAGKNLAGTFWQPRVVIADTDTLATLPENELFNGIGELIKYAVLDGGEMYSLMSEGFTGREERVVTLAVDSKRRIVEADEKEGGVRRLLNLGHTVAHAIEKLSDYTVGHGAAVATGIAYIARASRKHFGLSSRDYEAVAALLKKYSVEEYSAYGIKELCAAAAVDKKTAGGYINLVVIGKIGGCRTEKIPMTELEEYLS